MALYQFQLRTNADDVAQQVDHELADDVEAFKTAEALSVDFNVEITQGRRFVVHIMKGSRSAKRVAA